MADPIVTLFCTNGVNRKSETVQLTGMAGLEMFPTIQGTGDAFLEVYLGPLQNMLTLDPLPNVPAGFFPGVTDGEGFAVLSPGAAFNFGSSNVLNDVGVSFPTSYGMCQCPVGKTHGRWSFMAVVGAVDLFSNQFGIGWGQAYAGGAGMQPTFWEGQGQYGPGNPNGGANIVCGGFNTYLPTFGAQGVVLGAGAFNMGITGSIFVASIDLDPPVDLASYDPQKLIPQIMPCVPCCPVPCKGRFI